MSTKHPIISATGSSGAGTTSVRNTFGTDLPTPEYLKPRTALNEDEGLTQAKETSAVAGARRVPTELRMPTPAAGDAPSCATCGMLMARQLREHKRMFVRGKPIRASHHQLSRFLRDGRQGLGLAFRVRL